MRRIRIIGAIAVAASVTVSTFAQQKPPQHPLQRGTSALRGRVLDSRDIRSGMALVAAALAADGQSTVLEIETVERGYANLVERLVTLGAHVERRE